jgi:hypothetical protein
MIRTHVEIDGRVFPLAEGRDVVDLMARIEAAARTAPTFVDLSGDGRVSVLISAATRVVVRVVRESIAENAELEPFILADDWNA